MVEGTIEEKGKAINSAAIFHNTTDDAPPQHR